MKFGLLKLNGGSFVAAIDAERSLFWRASLLADDVPGESSVDMSKFIEWSLNRKLQIPSGNGEVLRREALCAPLINPPHNVMCVGKNYHAHAREFSTSGYDNSSDNGANASPDAPIIFTKPSSSINSPDGIVEVDGGIGQSLDYEAELAVVIGRGGRSIARKSALDHIFGYTIVNDITARDLQQKHKQWFLGKGIDGFCPMGPWIVTKDEIDNSNLRVICRVNGEERQNAPTTDLIFDIPTLIETISRSVTLSPGDVIATGTPAGVGIGFNPPKFLKDGDVVECEVPSIGTIRNQIRILAVQ